MIRVAKFCKIQCLLLSALLLSLVAGVAVADTSLATKYLQLGAFSQQQNAERLTAHTQQLIGHPVVIERHKVKDRTLYFVEIHRFANLQQYQQIQQRLASAKITFTQKSYPLVISHKHPHPLVSAVKKTKPLKSVADKQGYVYVIGKSRVDQVDAEDHIYSASGREQDKKPKQLSLREAVLLALRYNPNVQNAEIDRVLQKFDLRLAYNNFELQFALTGNVTSTRSRSAGIRQSSTTAGVVTPEVSLNNTRGGNVSLQMANNIAGNNYNPAVTLNATQPLLRNGGRDVALNPLRDAIDNETINKLNMSNEIITAVSTVINDYYAVVRNNNNIITAKQSVNDAKRTIEINNAKIKEGQLQPTANIEAESQLEQLRLSMAQAINSRDISKQRLLETLGLDPNMKIKIPKDVVVKNQEAPNMQETIDYALAHNIQYQTNLIAYKKDKRALTVAKNQQLWQLDLAANATVGGGAGSGKDAGFVSLINSRNNSQSVSLQLSVPIDDLQRQQQLVAARIALEKDKINLAAAQRSLVTSIRSQVINIQSQIQQIKLAERAVDLAGRSYKVETVKAQFGRSSSINVTTAQDSLINSRIQLINNKIAYLLAVAQLDSDLTTTLDKWKIKIRY